ncbi:MAG: oligosaccharide flippase family protein, partial [Firmicutes bacterium]|nr:oligosaccharide flippase family protein [Candidatus Caballimonas caccae]
MENKAVKGSFYLGVGAFLSKVIGAIYRIPLLNIITAEGVGLYQMVFPLYCILLDFAGSGAPNAIAKLISSKGKCNLEINSKKYLNSSLKILMFLGVLFSAIMLISSYPLSKLQGNTNAFYGYVFLSPAIFFVALISAFRGYFQGKMNMVPTAVSQIIEQITKLLFGLTFTYILMPNIPFAVGGATLSVTISEIIAFIYLYISYKREKINVIELEIEKEEKKQLIKEI